MNYKLDRIVVLDCEVYPNYFLIAFKNRNNNKVSTIEIIGADNCLSDLQIKKCLTILSKYTTVGFNSRNYDIPIILFALKRKTAKEIHQLSDYIIDNSSLGWQTMQKFELYKPQQINHIDIQEPSPAVRISLKLYGARMHSKYLQDLPIEQGTTLSDEDIELIRSYCINDLDTTVDLYNHIEPRIQLRYEMSLEYNQDLLSKSDAQIAEAVIKSQITKLTGKKLYAPKISKDTKYKYEVPEFIQFKTDKLKSLLENIQDAEFELNEYGSVQIPESIKDLKIKIGESEYQIGIGGIHSTENKQTIIPSEDELLIDQDVASYYPAIILNLGLYPKQLGKVFLDVYKNIVDKRLIAKKEGNKIVNESLKIVINGSFGKLGSKWSALYSPDLLLQVTLTGQLSLLMIIEELEQNGIQVVSANTDGFVSLLKKTDYEKFKEISSCWQNKTNFVLESNEYKALYSRDVNNYLAVTDSGYKGKGIFTLNQLSKNPHADISTIAVVEFITNGTPIHITIKNCKDLKKFLIARKVTGGAKYNDEFLGKVVRWICAKNDDNIKYVKNDNKVAKSDGCYPVMRLTDTIPDCIDYDRYVGESINILSDIGYFNNL